MVFFFFLGCCNGLILVGCGGCGLILVCCLQRLLMVGFILDCDYGGFVVDSGWWGILHLFIFINIVGVF